MTRKIGWLVVGFLVLGGASAQALPDRTFESFQRATGQNIRIASQAQASGEYGVSLGSNADAADATPLFGVCEKCDDPTPTYVFAITAAGNWTLDASAPLITTASAAAGLNLGIASAADASGEYGVVVGTTAAAAAGLDLFATAVDVDGTPIYSLVVETIAAGGTGARVYNTATAAGQNISLTSGANASGEYGAVAGTDAAVSDGTQIFAACADCDGTPAYHFTVTAAGQATVGTGGTGTVFAGTYDVTGAAGITIGSADVTAITLTTDGAGTGEVVLPLQSVEGAEMVNDTVDGAQLADTLTFDATLLGLANGTTGAVTLNLHDYADTADDDMAHVVMTANCTDVGTGAEDCDFTVGVVEAGAAAETRFEIDADGGVTVGSANTNSFTVTTDGTGTGEVVLPLQSVEGAELVNDTVDGAQLADTITFDATLLGVANATTGDVTLNWHDYADATDDDMAHVVMTANCTDTGTGAEDCDFSIGVVEAGAAAETRFSIDADAGVTIGSANTNSVTLTTSATGDAALVLPTGGVSTGEILDGTIEAADEAYAGRGQIVICGTLDTIASNTVYYGPNTAVTATAIGGMTCDTTATGNVTEATADEPAFAAKAFHVRGMVCRNADTNVTSVSYTLRSAAADLTPSVTCSVGDGVLDCVADVQTTTAIASGATFAVAAAEADEAVGAVVFVCVIDIAY